MVGKTSPEDKKFMIIRRFLQTCSARHQTPDPQKAGTEVGPAATPPSSSGTESRGKFMGTGAMKGRPTALDKQFLVWTGVYKSTSEVPSMLEPDVIHRARSWGRIRINIGFLFVAAIGGVLMVYSGKKAAARGESVEKRNIEWHRQIKEDYEKNRSPEQK